VVVSVHILGGGSDPAAYYLTRQANCSADYYLGVEPAGRWLGGGAAAAGHSGWIDTAGARALRGYLAGQSPDDQILVPALVRADPRGRLDAKLLVDSVRNRAEQQGVSPVAVFTEPADRAAWIGLEARVDRARRGRPPTVSPARARQLAEAAGLDVRTMYRAADGSDRYAVAARFAGKRVDARRPGIDVTISAPKSVSLLFGLGDAKTAAAVRDAHRAAVGEALAYLEAQAGHGLRGHQGDGQRAERIPTDGWIVAAFEHHTSRTGDPQLHTHLVVPNLLHGADGKWSAIDSKAVYRNALTASYVYQAVLRGELTRRLGVAWTTPVKGIAEIAGMPRDLLRKFSTRRRQIEEAMADAGVSGPDAAQAACLATRPAKPAPESPGSLRNRWVSRARAAGHHPTEVIPGVLGRGRVPTAPPIDQLALHLLGPSGLTAQATGFDRRDLLQALCQGLPVGLPVDREVLEAAADRVLRHRDVVRLATRSEHGPRWSTAELLAAEQHGLRVAAELRNKPGLLSSPRLDEGRPAAKLTAEQRNVAGALAAAAGLAVLVGPAGSGKTAALAHAVKAWAGQGRPVVGGAVAAVTARRLEHATGVQSSSLARLLHAARSTGGTAVPNGGVLVVDEVSMVDTRTLVILLAQAHAGGGTLVLVGDPAQLPEIGAGGLFAALARHEGTLVLTDNRRQTEDWERRALVDLRAGDPGAALGAYARHGRVHTARADRLVERLVDDYLRHLDAVTADRAAPAERVVMLAVRRSDVADLNNAVRQRLIADGRLGGRAVVVDTDDEAREYRAGDRVLVRANDHRRGLLNGTRAEVTAVDPRRGTLTLRADGDPEQTVPTGWAAYHLDHGYAMTCYKAQGATVDVALVYGGGGLSREAGYVALSRGRMANHLYVPESTERDRASDGRDGLDLVAARLWARRAQVLATRQLPRRTSSWTSPSHLANRCVRAEGISR